MYFEIQVKETFVHNA